MLAQQQYNGHCNTLVDGSSLLKNTGNFSVLVTTIVHKHPHRSAAGLPLGPSLPMRHQTRTFRT